MTDFFDLIELEKFYDNHPDSVIFAFLAAQYLNIGQVEKALEVAEKGIHKHPSYGFGHYVLGLCHFETNDHAKAKTHLELSVAYDDKNPAAFKRLGEINEKLELPLMARDSFIQYFLLNNFEKDAVEKFDQSEMNAFNAFENIPLDDAPETSGEAVIADTTADDETFSIDDYFDDDMKSDESLDISEKVDEVFKESLGDVNIETNLEDRESDEPGGPDDAFENLEFLDLEEQSADAAPDATTVDEPLKIVDELTEDSVSQGVAEGEDFETALDAAFDNFTGESGAEISPEPAAEAPFESELTTPDETADIASETAEAGDDADVDIVAELDEFFAEYDNEEDELEGKSSSEDESLEFGNILFDEPAGTEAADKVMDTDQDLDLDSLVDDIITERKDEAQELADEAGTLLDNVSETAEASETEFLPETSSDMSATISLDDASSKLKETPGNPNKSGFSSPPILSPTLGEIYISQGRFDEAVDVFQQLLEKDPDNERFKKKIRDVQAMMKK